MPKYEVEIIRTEDKLAVMKYSFRGIDDVLYLSGAEIQFLSPTEALLYECEGQNAGT